MRVAQAEEEHFVGFLEAGGEIAGGAARCGRAGRPVVFRVAEQLQRAVADGGVCDVEVGLFMRSGSGYTLGMKTAVSVPNEVFERAERLARRLGVSRSELYSRALREYLGRHSPDEVTEALDAVCEELGTGADEFVREAGGRVLQATDW